MVLPARPPCSGFAWSSHKNCALISAQRGEYTACGYSRFAPIVCDTASAGWRRPSLVVGSPGCFFCNCLQPSAACGYFRFAPIVRDARLISFTRDLVVGQKLFPCRVGRGFAPLDLPVLIPRVKKRPSPRDPRGVPRETIPSTAKKGRCRAGRVRLRPLPTFSGRFRYTGRVTAAMPPTKSAAVSGLTSSPETLPRFSCPRNPLSVGLTLAVSCWRGLTRPVSAAVVSLRETRRGGCPALVVARGAASPRRCP